MAHRRLLLCSLLLLPACALPHAPFTTADGPVLADARPDADANDDATIVEDVPMDTNDGSADADVAIDVIDAADAADAMEAGMDVIRPDADASIDARPDALPDARPDALPDSRPDSMPDSMPDSAPDAAADANTNRDSGVVIRLGTPVAGSWVQGSALAPFPTDVRCPAGYLVIGARAILGYDALDSAVLEGYTLDCAQLQTNGTLSGAMSSITVGSTAAIIRTTTRSVSCGPNEVSVPRDVRTGIVIDTVRLDCVSLAPLLQTGTRTVTGTIDFTLLGGGSPQAATCPANHVLVGLDARQANYFGPNRVSGVRPVCAPIVISAP